MEVYGGIYGGAWWGAAGIICIEVLCKYWSRTSIAKSCLTKWYDTLWYQFGLRVEGRRLFATHADWWGIQLFNTTGANTSYEFQLKSCDAQWSYIYNPMWRSTYCTTLCSLIDIVIYIHIYSKYVYDSILVVYIYTHIDLKGTHQEQVCSFSNLQAVSVRPADRARGNGCESIATWFANGSTSGSSKRIYTV